MHSKEAVNGLIMQLSTQRDEARRRAALTTLVRLYHREAEYQGDWWGTRPDTTGPYYDRATWEMSAPIAAVIHTVIADDDPEFTKYALAELKRHRVVLKGLPTPGKVATKDEKKPIVIATADPNDKTQIGNRVYEEIHSEALLQPGDVGRGQKLFVAQSCMKCHTTANGQKPKGPHLVDIGKRYKPSELVESVLKPSAKIAQGFDTYGFVTTEGRIIVGFVTSESAEQIQVRQLDGVPITIEKKQLDERVKQSKSMMPDGLVDNLTPQQLGDLLAYLQSLN
jgi:putative heme-binding domain-containing protein